MVDIGVSVCDADDPLSLVNLLERAPSRVVPNASFLLSESTGGVLRNRTKVGQLSLHSVN